ncbi:hypothetical protein HRbin29_00652 [bacterium HR29]|nr:hypothetical protein HRbin29_00652 [bacterium HR29]
MVHHLESGNHDPCPGCRRVHGWFEPLEGGAAYRRLRGNDIDRRHRCERGELWCGQNEPHLHRITDRWTVVASPVDEPRLVHEGEDVCYRGLDGIAGPVGTEVEPLGHRTLECRRWVERSWSTAAARAR